MVSQRSPTLPTAASTFEAASSRSFTTPSRPRNTRRRGAVLACVVGSLVAAFFFAEMQSTPSTLNGVGTTSSTQLLGNNSGAISQDETAPVLVERPEEQKEQKEQKQGQDETVMGMGGVRNFKNFEEYVVSPFCVPVAFCVGGRL